MDRAGSSTKKSWRNRFRVYKIRRLDPFWQAVKWTLIGGVWVLAIALGYLGFFRHSLAVGEELTGMDHLYRAIQLTVLESGNVKGPVPWELQVARFLMPALAGYTAIQALLAVFRDQWQLLRARFLKNHVVLCGLDERGLRFAQEFLDHGYQVVVLEGDRENPLLDQIRKQGAVVITGDAADRNLLRRAGVPRAGYLIAACPDDGTNGEITLNARNLARLRKGRALTAFVHIVDPDLCNLLSAWSLAATETDSFRLEFFNVFERAAQLMLKEYPPFKKELETAAELPRILIVGLGKVSKRLLVQAARNWWMKHAGNAKRLRITVIDKQAEKKIGLLRLQYPQLDRACEIELWPFEKGEPEFEKGDFLFNSDGRCDLGVIYVSFDNDVDVVVNALTLHRKTRQYRIPIVMRMSGDAGLATLMKDDCNAIDFEQIHVFSFLDQTCCLEALLGGAQGCLARAIHESYVQHQQENGATVETNPAMTDWEDLPEDLKESNRHQAAHVEDKLKAVDCGIQPLNDWEAASFAFSPAEVELLAEMEHERWCEERRHQGWAYNSGPKNIKKKTSPHLVPWEQLSDDIKEYDRNTVRELPAFLARAGFQICRRA